jgi:predicted nucleic acid-binding protein
MTLVDASVLVAAMRDRTGAHARKLLDFAGDDEIVICRFTELELLAGARDEAEWRSLKSYFAAVGVLGAAAKDVERRGPDLFRPATQREHDQEHHRLLHRANRLGRRRDSRPRRSRLRRRGNCEATEAPQAC